MARARNIKPGFFTNEQLVECGMETRLLFIGMWTIADREGRLEDRPKRIKMQLFPADNVDVDACLDQLTAMGFLERYEASGQRYIQVVNWDKHQNPHIKEAPSTIPAPDSHDTCTVLAPDEPPLIPDSLIPDSLNTDTGFLEDDEARARATSTAETLCMASFVGDDEATVLERVLRSLELVPAFDIHDGPLEAEKFGRYHSRAKKQPVDWFAAWLNWIKRSVANPPHRNGHSPPKHMTADERSWENMKRADAMTGGFG